MPEVKVLSQDGLLVRAQALGVHPYAVICPEEELPKLAILARVENQLEKAPAQPTFSG